jgi:hypothetical protein
MRVQPKGLGDDLVQLQLDLEWGLAWSQASAVGYSEDVRVDREGLFTERCVQDDIGRLAADTRQRFQLLARARHLASMLVDQRLAERDYVFGLGVEQADRLDRPAQTLLAERHHLLWRLDFPEERPGGDIDARIRRLRGKHDSDEQGVRVVILELGRRGGVLLGEPTEELEDHVAFHRESTTSRIE